MVRGIMTRRRPGIRLSMDDAAQQLGMEPAAVRLFVQLGLLRVARVTPFMMWAAEVDRLQQVLPVRRAARPERRAG